MTARKKQTEDHDVTALIQDRIYTINGKRVLQRPMSPLQVIRVTTILAKIQDVCAVHVKSKLEASGDTLDLSVVIEYVNYLDFERRDLVEALINAILIDPDTYETCDYRGRQMLTYDDFKTIAPKLLLEMIADFFSLNDVLNVFAVLSTMKQAFETMKSINTPGPSAK